MRMESHKGVGTLKGDVRREGLKATVESGLSCQRQQEPLPGLRKCSRRLGCELARPGESHNSGWCRDSGNGEKQMDWGCILEVRLIGFFDRLQVGGKG